LIRMGTLTNGATFLNLFRPFFMDLPHLFIDL
jgi:hypothetical protein